jgi:hypothetical protein
MSNHIIDPDNLSVAQALLSSLTSKDDWGIDVDSADTKPRIEGEKAVFNLTKSHDVLREDRPANYKGPGRYRPIGTIIYTITVTSEYEKFDE